MNQWTTITVPWWLWPACLYAWAAILIYTAARTTTASILGSIFLVAIAIGVAKCATDELTRRRPQYTQPDYDQDEGSKTR